GVRKTRSRRVAAAIVSRLATANAAISTRMDSHRPRSLASLAVLDSDPVTWLARLEAVVTVAPGRRLLISACPAGGLGGAGALPVRVVPAFLPPSAPAL